MKDGDWPKVRNLQKLMLRSWSNTQLSVRQVAQRNAGRTTAGIDGKVALTSAARMDLAVQTHGSPMPDNRGDVHLRIDVVCPALEFVAGQPPSEYKECLPYQPDEKCSDVLVAARSRFTLR
jgi:N-terminal domain of reverse transcriptase